MTSQVETKIPCIIVDTTSALGDILKLVNDAGKPNPSPATMKSLSALYKLLPTDFPAGRLKRAKVELRNDEYALLMLSTDLHVGFRFIIENIRKAMKPGVEFDGVLYPNSPDETDIFDAEKAKACFELIEEQGYEIKGIWLSEKYKELGGLFKDQYDFTYTNFQSPVINALRAGTLIM